MFFKLFDIEFPACSIFVRLLQSESTFSYYRFVFSFCNHIFSLPITDGGIDPIAVSAWVF